MTTLARGSSTGDAADNATNHSTIGVIHQDWQRRVAHAFSRAAPRYASLASAQQALGERLWQRLPPCATNVLDLGCGPGHWTARLSRRYGITAIGLDLAPGMLIEARNRHTAQGQWICADANRLPLADGRLDVVFSNLALQWCRDPQTVFAELHRTLAPGGQALINTLGPGTLHEIDTAWSRPGRPAALLDFLDAETLVTAARKAGFRNHSVERHTARFHYPDLTTVMMSIKGVGAQLSLDNRSASLTRGDVARAARRFEALREAAGLPVSYRCLTLSLRKGKP